MLSVLANYKRTVADFGKCGGRASTEYGFSHVSECVQPKSFDGQCPDSKVPVPCDDGQCHSDYISCLRALVDEQTNSSKHDRPEQQARSAQVDFRKQA